MWSGQPYPSNKFKIKSVHKQSFLEVLNATLLETGKRGDDNWTFLGPKFLCERVCPRVTNSLTR